MVDKLSPLNWINKEIPNSVLHALLKSNWFGWLESAKWFLQGIQKSWLSARSAKWLHFHCGAGKPSLHSAPRVWLFANIVTTEMLKIAQCSAR